MAADSSDLLGVPLPKELEGHYPLSHAEMNEGLGRSIQKKYLHRPHNIGRCWNRAQLYTPELMKADQKKSILELSTGHGAMLEIYRHLGHEVLGTDYPNVISGPKGFSSAFRSINEDLERKVDDYGLAFDPSNPVVDWPYKRLIESIGIPMTLFDAGSMPYPLADKSFDYVMTFQAIEHYTHPRHWLEIIGELCRIARESVVLLLNPLFPAFAKDPDYAKAFDDFRREMAFYNANGFHCTSVHMHWSLPLGFKLTSH